MAGTAQDWWEANAPVGPGGGTAPVNPANPTKYQVYDPTKHNQTTPTPWEGVVPGTETNPNPNQPVITNNPASATQGRGGAPTGNLSDPAFARQFVAYWASQPGANPSLTRDPDYWIGKITSGELGPETDYIVSKFMLPEGAPAGGGFGSLMQPFGREFSFGDAPNIAPFRYGEFNAPAAFEAPTAEEALDNPGYQFRLKEGQKALEMSAAARGTLRTGGTLKDLINYGQEAATQEYDKVYNRELGTYETNYQNAASTHNMNSAGAYRDWAANAQNEMSTWDRNYGKALDEFKTAYGIFSDQGNNTFSRLYNLTSLGMSGAQSIGAPPTSGISSLITGAGANAAGAVTDRANVDAAGRIGSSNVWQNFGANAGNNLLDAALWATTHPKAAPYRSGLS